MKKIVLKVSVILSGSEYDAEEIIRMGSLVSRINVGQSVDSLEEAVRWLFVEPEGPASLIEYTDGWTVEVEETDG